MFSYFYNLYNRCIKQSQENANNLLAKVYTYFFYYFCNTILIAYYKISRKWYKIIVRKEPTIIVSLTTYPKRINTVWITIESLFRQEQKPDMIILWLAEEQFPDKKLPQSLVNLQKRGLAIKWCDNLMSHKKYFYVCQYYPQACIITADDDLIYPPYFVRRLWNLHNRYPKDVIALTCLHISPTYSTVPSKWAGISREKKESSNHISIYSGSGALFPPGSLPSEAFNKDAIRRLCPFADDLWLTVMTHMNGVKTTNYEYTPFPIVVRATLNDSLFMNYNSATEDHPINNDTQWTAITCDYKEQLKTVLGDFY